MKTLFLDIDGVLNSEDNMRALHKRQEYEKTFKHTDEFGHLFDERCVNWLRWIIYKTQCQIVISSTWRIDGLEELKAMWRKRNLPGRLFGITPLRVSPEVISKYSLPDKDISRGLEIQEWLDIYQPQQYCIVDDIDNMLPNQNFVKTNPAIGLDEQSTYAIVSFLDY